VKPDKVWILEKLWNQPTLGTYVKNFFQYFFVCVGYWGLNSSLTFTRQMPYYLSHSTSNNFPFVVMLAWGVLFICFWPFPLWFWESPRALLSYTPSPRLFFLVTCNWVSWITPGKHTSHVWLPYWETINEQYIISIACTGENKRLRTRFKG
jgi:hypothetical protein